MPPCPSNLKFTYHTSTSAANSKGINHHGQTAERIDNFAFNAEDWTGGRTDAEIDGVVPKDKYDVLKYTIPPSKSRAFRFTCRRCGHRKGTRTAAQCNNKLCYSDGMKRRQFKDKVESPGLIRIERTSAGDFGVVAQDHITMVGTVLQEYLGELLPNGHPRCGTDPTQASTYLVKLGSKCHIDALYKGNWTRYINSSCRPNVQFQEAVVGDRHTVLVVVIRPIAKREELFLDYGKAWFDHYKIKCRCNEPGCHGKSA